MRRARMLGLLLSFFFLRHTALLLLVDDFAREDCNFINYRARARIMWTHFELRFRIAALDCVDVWMIRVNDVHTHVRFF